MFLLSRVERGVQLGVVVSGVFATNGMEKSFGDDSPLTRCIKVCENDGVGSSSLSTVFVCARLVLSLGGMCVCPLAKTVELEDRPTHVTRRPEGAAWRGWCESRCSSGCVGKLPGAVFCGLVCCGTPKETLSPRWFFVILHTFTLLAPLI